jgi:hypothetical protein
MINITIFIIYFYITSLKLLSRYIIILYILQFYVNFNWSTTFLSNSGTIFSRRAAKWYRKLELFPDNGLSLGKLNLNSFPGFPGLQPVLFCKISACG